VRIPAKIYEELLAHAREDAPNECCGLIGGRDGAATTYYRARNIFESPLRYQIHSEDVLHLLNRIEEQGEEMLGIFHSHTGSPAFPSQTDINMAFGDGPDRPLLWPGTLYLIASLAEGEEPLRAFDITDAGEVVEVDLAVE
jgi:[CysO sulfur-carrier protein]-S-L-cysteine hydrolase